MEIFFQGAAVGAGLIIAIGAQNSFVLSQGIKRQHRLTIVLLCSLSDIVLICAGAAGIGAVVATSRTFQDIAAWCGALFLFWYGARSLMSALRGGAMDCEEKERVTRKTVILATLGLTFLNPHVYIDTIVLIGGISGQYEGLGRYLFACGAGFASCLWFFSLAYGASFLAPLFKKRISWRILDSIICLVMWVIGAKLLPVDWSQFLGSVTLVS